MNTKKFIILLMLSAHVCAAQPPPALPHELQFSIDALQLKEMDILYEHKAPCVLVTGISRYNQWVAYVALRYIGSGSTFHWTPFVPIPLVARNDSLKIEYFGPKIAFFQWDSDVGFASLSGCWIEFDRERATVKLRRISIAELVELFN